MASAFTNNSSLKLDFLSGRWIDLRLVSATRLMLAGSASLITLISPIEPNHFFWLSYAILTAYTAYSIVFFLLSVRHTHLIAAPYMHWVDLAWFLSLIAVSGGTGSVFFDYFFFAILVASFGWGFTSGLRVTLAAVFLYTVVSLLATPSPSFELNRLMLRDIQLLILGYMISRWGGFKVNLRNRLQLLKDITVLSNPRFGINRTITGILESLRSFYDADACLWLISTPENNASSSYQMYRVRRGAESIDGSLPIMPAEAAGLFLLPWSNHAVIHNNYRQTTLFDVNTEEFSVDDSTRSDRVASALETTHYLSVPVQNRNQPAGRLYVIGGPQRYDHSAVDFVMHLMDHATPLIENIRLVDSLASSAAEEERRRIARDIHDSVIQPYVGLQLGIAALAQKVHRGNTDIVDNVEELLELTNQELVELRRYVWGLRAGEERRDILLPAIERFAARFTSVTGIKVDVSASGKIVINDRLAAELFQMVTEGLSNVRRHALCDDASVDLRCQNGKIVLQIKNRRPGVSGNLVLDGDHKHNEQPLFMPRSIYERAELLGGKTTVSIDDKNYTVVTVAIPL